MYSVYFYTLGCKVNIYETNALKTLFLEKGFVISNDEKQADVYVINTCTVTSKADQKSRKTINRAISNNKSAIIVVIGCFSQTKSDYTNENVDIILGNNNKIKVVEKVEELLKLKQEKEVEKQTFFKEIIDIENEKSFESLNATSYDHTRAFIKIQDGCENFCSYCIIPYARGPIKSKNKDLVIKEIEYLVNEGFKEIVLCGIHTGKYNDNGIKLSDLIEEIFSKVLNLKRLRLSSIEINEIDEKILTFIKDNKVFSSHLHLPLQSGSDKVLKDMNRKYTTSEYLDIISKIRECNKDISITTDIIVGYPTESEEDFIETMSFAKKVNFSKIHVFPYSRRENTPSAKLKEIEPSVLKRRVNKLIELSNELNNKYILGFKNKILDIIIETHYDNNYMIGHSSNYIKVLILKNDLLIGSHKLVKITDIKDNFLIGTLI